MSLKKEILKLRENGLSYNEISSELNCSKATVSYHCTRNNKNDIGLGGKKMNEEELNEMKEYYKTHTIKETAKEFGISETTVKFHTDNKREILNDKERRKRNYLRIKSRRQKNKERAVEYKGGKCVKCGYDKCIWALDFHHKDPSEKEFNFSKYSTFSWEKIKKEIDKCILICSNCHREIHYDIYLKQAHTEAP